MEDELISFETAVLAQEKRFNVPSMYFYEGDYQSLYTYDTRMDWTDIQQSPNKSQRYNAPTQSLLQRWLREKHGMIILIGIDLDKNDPKDRSKYTFSANWEVPGNDWDGWYDEDGQHSSYEKALEVGLQEGLKLIKDV